MKLVFTICNRTQLSHAICLGESLREHAPGHLFVLGWVDTVQLPTLPDWIQVINIPELGLTAWPSMQGRYFDFELLAACKPFFARHLLQQYPNCQELIYLSPSTCLFGSLDSIVEPEAFVQLTPNRTRPIEPQTGLLDRNVLNIGMYHSNSLIIHPQDSQTTKFLNWWCDRTLDRAAFNLCEGMCLDQLWLNYLPVYYENIHLIREEGWHLGLHQAGDSLLATMGSQYTVDGRPLISIDFVGIESYHPFWSDHAHMVRNEPAWQNIRNRYRKMLTRNSVSIKSSTPPYGKPSLVKSNRRIRKQGVQFVKQLIY
ncbi:MAG: hypothetical protein KKG00_03770, partial [Bacteroidetes bacterium]|nr:hypothetical protein [Bacteroidota bacterium]